MLFEDNFDIVDRSRWETAWFSNVDYTPPVNDNGGACFHPRQITAVGGAIEMRIDPNSDDRCRLKNGGQANFVGALMNTRETFTFSYGYAEARMFLPGSAGSLHNWPAFWHTGFDWPATGEVDIVEGLSGGQPCAVYHYLEGGVHQQDKGCVNWPDPSGWHTFAANWEPGRVTYYYDGVEVFQTTRGVVGDPHYLILDYTVRANGEGTSVPSSMLVDYVRVWQSTG